MGPICNNYGTFVVPSGSCEVQVWRDGGGRDADTYQQDPAHHATFESLPSSAGIDCCVRRRRDGSFGYRLRTEGAEAVIAEVDEDVSRVSML